TEEEARRRASKDDARVEGTQWRSSRAWLVPAGGGTEEALTDGSRHVTRAAWSPDGARIAIVTTPTPEADSTQDGRLQVVEGWTRSAAWIRPPRGRDGSGPRRDRSRWPSARPAAGRSCPRTRLRTCGSAVRPERRRAASPRSTRIAPRARSRGWSSCAGPRD